MHKAPVIALLVPLALAISLTGCEPKSQAPAQSSTPPQTGTQSSLDRYLEKQRAAAAGAQVLATVNGVPITDQSVAGYASDRGVDNIANLTPEALKAVVQDLIKLELLLQRGLKEGLDQSPGVVAEVEKFQRTAVANALFRQYLSSNTVSDEMLQARYDELKKDMAATEYHARHILLESEEEARDVIKKLDGGADFAELAKELSKGPSGKDGGDLGWFTSGDMVKPFSDAVATMQKGNYSKDPVQTEFGWHVILLEDQRAVEPPSLDTVKAELANQMQREQFNAYLETLSAAADIEVK